MTRPRDLRRRHNLTSAQKDVMLQHQEHRCSICKTDDPGKCGWHIDHDHNKKIDATRQLLCGRCNTGLGFFKDDAGLLIRAARYLLKHNGRSVEKYVCRF
jgi:hypothetical protein